MLLDLTGVRSSAFMLLYGTVCVFIFMHFSFRPESAAIARRQPARFLPSSENPMSTHVLALGSRSPWQQTGARIANRNRGSPSPR